ncbi:MAG: twin-arginine translocase TatA/TatE family subunit [Nitrospirae bacterium]|nr:twin-arginine translocase TatA/TatE family subunit [Nitrospirota bacterium]
MFGLGMQELVIVFLIVFVLFGATKLPQIGKGMGEAIRNFKKAISGINDEVSAITKKGDEKINSEV